MNGTSGLSMVGAEIAAPEKRRPNWLQIAIGVTIAFLLHAAVFLILVGFQKHEPRPINYHVITWPTPVDEMIRIEPEPRMMTRSDAKLAATVYINKWPIQTSAANLASIEIIDPDDEEDEFDLMGWFGPSMEF